MLGYANWITTLTKKKTLCNQARTESKPSLHLSKDSPFLCFVTAQTLGTPATCSPCHLAHLTLWCTMKQKLIQDTWVSFVTNTSCFLVKRCLDLCVCPTDSLTLEMDVASPMWRVKIIILCCDREGSNGGIGYDWSSGLVPVYIKIVSHDREINDFPFLFLCKLIMLFTSTCSELLLDVLMYVCRKVIFLKLFLPLLFEFHMF